MSNADFATVGARLAGCALSAPANTRVRLVRRAGGIAVLVLAVLASVLAPPAGASTGLPAASVQPVSIAGTRPLGRAVVALADRGYREAEYYVAGTANRYRVTAPTTTAEVIDRGWPYKSRMLVRRPSDPRRFNGTVVVEWLNVTTGQDIDFVWNATHDLLMREGYAWVGITAQRVGIAQLKTWSPQRYGTLSAEASNVDPATGALLDPPRFPAAGGDVLAWDIFAQAAEALRDHAGADPLRDLKVRQLIAAGESQSAGRLTTYYNALQPLHEVFDGFLYYDAAGPLRSDVAVPAISMESEWRSSNGVGSVDRDPLAPDTPFLRRWQVAGTSHVSLDEMHFVDAMIARDQSLHDAGGTPVTLTQLISDCQYQPLWSTVPNWVVLSSALEHVNDWIITGRPAPTAPRLEFDTSASPPVLKRDAEGHVLGGIRLPQFAIPTAENRAINFGPGFCTLAGSHRFYTRDELRARYGNHGRYVAQVAHTTLDLSRDGFILPHDALRIVIDAARSGVGH
jgi:hypothetical protein